jgi:hypothetical protein
MEELLSIYSGWQVSIERNHGRADTVLATKVA